MNALSPQRTPGRQRSTTWSALLLLASVIVGAGSWGGARASSRRRPIERPRAGTVTWRALSRQAPNPLSHVPAELLVRFRRGSSAAALRAALAAVPTTFARRFHAVDRLYQLKLAAGTGLSAALQALRSRRDVEYVEPNYVVGVTAVPDDARFANQWPLRNDGQTGGAPGADLGAVAAWNLTSGRRDVVVAVLDTGIDYRHPDLAANVYVNDIDCDADLVDDDANGYIDDCHGVDVVNDDSDPMDDEGHGTHVAGIIGATGNNGVGVAGVNWEVTLLPCKFLDASGTGDVAGAIACLDYVATMKERGVNVVATNNSWSGGLYSQALVDAIEAQQQRGILFVAAAGNAGSDNDVLRIYPCAYEVPAVVCVAATDASDLRPGFSNYGRTTVHLGAPGAAVLSTLPGSAYGLADGTSMASPHVSGVAALLYAQDPGRDWKQVKNLLLAGGKKIPALSGATLTGRRLSAHGSLTCSGSTVLSRVRPSRDLVAGVGVTIGLSVLNVDCDAPGGAVSVVVSPGSETIPLADDGRGSDRTAGDGLFSGIWQPATAGAFTLEFPDGSEVAVEVDPDLGPGFPVNAYAGADALPEGWSADCSGRDSCVLTMDGPKSAAANFQGPLANPLGLLGVMEGDAEWGDYDGDGDLDLVVTGLVQSDLQGIPSAILYRNDDGALVASGIPLDQVAGFASWGDYDNDGDLDLVLGGTFIEPWSRTRLYRNDGGSFTAVAAPFLNVGVRPAAEWGDYDNDGDLDLVLAGEAGIGPVTRLYRNDGGAFVEVDAGLAGVEWGDVTWGDYDNDGDLDLLVVTRDATILYRNDRGVFTDAKAGLVGVVYGSADWADFDGDGDLDLALSGGTYTDQFTKIYRNDRGTFVELDTDVVGVTAGAVRWGDYDGDGDPDLLVTGRGPDSRGRARLYRNDGGRFSEVYSGLPEVYASNASWGDLDNDGRLDLVLLGFDQPSFASTTSVFRNLQSPANTPPSPPTNPRGTQESDGIRLIWDPAADAETPPSGLSYNVRVGTTPGGSDVLSAMADASSGFRWVVRLGNAGSNTNLALQGLLPGRYYWGVQAIDTSYVGSPFTNAESIGVPTRVSVADASAKEGHCGTSSVTFLVTLAEASLAPVSVTYETHDGTATVAEDYVATSGTLTFDPGVTSLPVTVSIIGETVFEPDETFSMVLTGATNATLVDGNGTGTILNDDVDPATGTEPVVWTRLVGVTTCGPAVTKTAPAGWGNAGASSRQQIGGNGYVEVTVPAYPGYAMFGLSSDDADQGYADIDFAFYTDATSGQVMIFEGGSYRGTFGAYAAGQKLRVSLDSGAVRYWSDDTLLYTSALRPAPSLRVDASLYSTGATVEAVLGGRLRDIPPPRVRPVIWVNRVGVSRNRTALVKTAPAGWGNAGASSRQQIGGNGYVEVTVPAYPGYAMFGLSSDDADQGYADIDFAFYTDATSGQVMIFEGGSYRGTFGAYAAGQKLRVSLDSGVVTYWSDDRLLYESGVTPAASLRVDTSLYSTGATIQGAVIGGRLVRSRKRPDGVPRAQERRR